MSGIPIIGKIFDLIEDIPILKVIVVAAVIYFTAGAAMGAFSSAGATTAAATAGTATTATATAAASTTAVAGTTAATTAGTAAAGTAAAGTVATTGVAAGTVAGTAAGTAAAGTAAGAATATSWFAANPMATMMLGQGLMGMAASSEADKTAKELAAAREAERKDRGLMGFDWEGQPGIVDSAMAPAPTVEESTVQAEQAPIVAGQQVATQKQPSATKVPVQRKDLPTLNQTGQLAAG